MITYEQRKLRLRELMALMKADLKEYEEKYDGKFAEKIGTKAAYQEQEDDGYVVEELSTEIRLAENV